MPLRSPKYVALLAKRYVMQSSAGDGSVVARRAIGPARSVANGGLLRLPQPRQPPAPHGNLAGSIEQSAAGGPGAAAAPRPGRAIGFAGGGQGVFRVGRLRTAAGLRSSSSTTGFERIAKCLDCGLLAEGGGPEVGMSV